MISDWQGSVRFDTSKICCYIRHSKGILIYYIFITKGHCHGILSYFLLILLKYCTEN